MRLNGEINLPGDKSISHRAIMLNSVAYGSAKIYNFLNSEDCLATMNCFKQLGVNIKMYPNYVEVIGNGYEGLKKPNDVINCLNSGTTARLMMGILHGLPFETTLIGDESLSKRPMKRVVKFLDVLGSKIELTSNNYLPAVIKSTIVKNGRIDLDVSSAQVKSACILAALKHQEQTVIKELDYSRNHTELMLKYLGCDIEVNGLEIAVSGKNKLKCKDIYVPGDISSSAFFIVAALIVQNSEIIIRNCGINETRTGILKVLDMIGANYEILNKRIICNEEVGDLLITYTKDLKPFVIEKSLIPLLIDEIPVLALLATQIDGISYIKDASELRIKETDRIKVTTSELNKLGAHITETSDGMIINGYTKLSGNAVDSFDDHRMSMMLKVARLITDNMEIKNANCDKISYPNFEIDLMKLIK
ncbi:MAG: aroE [Haloplasmataceae bacterium]|nr:aroE [Haloplasmataceae bacterium]